MLIHLFQGICRFNITKTTTKRNIISNEFGSTVIFVARVQHSIRCIISKINCIIFLSYEDDISCTLRRTFMQLQLIFPLHDSNDKKVFFSNIMCTIDILTD